MALLPSIGIQGDMNAYSPSSHPGAIVSICVTGDLEKVRAGSERGASAGQTRSRQQALRQFYSKTSEPDTSPPCENSYQAKAFRRHFDLRRFACLTGTCLRSGY